MLNKDDVSKKYDDTLLDDGYESDTLIPTHEFILEMNIPEISSESTISSFDLQVLDIVITLFYELLN
jgi:hypothetical protein